MTDFNAKHRKLYLEELKEKLRDENNYYYDYINNKQKDSKSKKVLNLSNIIDLLNKFDIKSKDVLIELLRTLKDNLNEYDFNKVIVFQYFFPHEKTLQDIVCLEFKDHLVDIILESRHAK